MSLGILALGLWAVIDGLAGANVITINKPWILAWVLVVAGILLLYGEFTGWRTPKLPFRRKHEAEA